MRLPTMLLLATFAFTLCACKDLPKQAAGAQAAPGAQAKPSTVPLVDTTSFYTALDIPQDADQKQIKKAYRKRSLKLHPDRCPDKDDEILKAKYEEEFKKIAEAFEILSDAAKRREYDQSITPEAKSQKAEQDRQDQEWRDAQFDLARAREQQQRRHDDAQRQYAEDQRNYWNAQAEAQKRQEAEFRRKAAEEALRRSADAERRQQVEQDRIYAQRLHAELNTKAEAETLRRRAEAYRRQQAQYQRRRQQQAAERQQRERMEQHRRRYQRRREQQDRKRASKRPLATFYTGDSVTLHGLTKQRHLNGQEAVLIELSGASRWLVELRNPFRRVKVAHANMTLKRTYKGRQQLKRTKELQRKKQGIKPQRKKKKGRLSRAWSSVKRFFGC